MWWSILDSNGGRHLSTQFLSLPLCVSVLCVSPISLLSHARLRCMCTCNRCTFCLCQNFLNSELLQTVRAKLYTVVLRRSSLTLKNVFLFFLVPVISSFALCYFLSSFILKQPLSQRRKSLPANTFWFFAHASIYKAKLINANTNIQAFKCGTKQRLGKIWECDITVSDYQPFVLLIKNKKIGGRF